jgi:dihydroorotase
MIDPHVHLRDGGQAAKETLVHGLSVAWRAGLDGVFEMPNTDPPLTTRDAILRRIDSADAALGTLGVGLFHGVYAGITAVPRQIEEIVKTWRELFPRVVGLKMFAGHSTGSMGLPLREEQALVYRTLAALGFAGVLAVHCEKEGMLRPTDWDPARPVTHAQARPPAAEVASVDDQLQLASRAHFEGTLHVCHISTPWALDLLRGRHRGETDEAPGVRVTCGLTPHHALLDANMLEEPEGMLLKVNPPLRPRPMPAMMLRRLFDGDIDWIESDHAPHTRADKLEGFASGIPGLPFLPVFLGMLAELGMPAAKIRRLSHDAICATFGITLAASGRRPELDLAREYPFDPFAVLVAQNR